MEYCSKLVGGFPILSFADGLLVRKVKVVIEVIFPRLDNQEVWSSPQLLLNGHYSSSNDHSARSLPAHQFLSR